MGRCASAESCKHALTARPRIDGTVLDFLGGARDASRGSVGVLRTCFRSKGIGGGVKDVSDESPGRLSGRVEKHGRKALAKRV